MNKKVSDVHSWEQLNSLLQLRSLDSDAREVLRVTTELVTHGLSKRAILITDQLVKTQSNAIMLRVAERLRNIALNLQHHNIEKKVVQRRFLFQNLLSVEPVYIAGPNRDFLIIVFATGWNNFGISLPLFYEMLHRRSASIIFVKNATRGMYCNGANGFGGSIDEIALRIKKFIVARDYKKVMVFGFSSGGYASLYTAAVIEAERYVGFGIRTDWAKDSSIPKSVGRAAPTQYDYVKNTLINLRRFDRIHNISNISLYYGDRDTSDTAHAQNMADLENVTQTIIKGSTHNVILELVSMGTFSRLINEHVDQFSGADPNKTAWHPVS